LVGEIAIVAVDRVATARITLSLGTKAERADQRVELDLADQIVGRILGTPADAVADRRVDVGVETVPIAELEGLGLTGDTGQHHRKRQRKDGQSRSTHARAGLDSFASLHFGLQDQVGYCVRMTEGLLTCTAAP